jgi:thiamine-phosphate pyrophosphorylase
MSEANAPSGAGRRIEPRLVVVTDRSVLSAGETLRRVERLARAARPFSVMVTLRDRELSAVERLAFGRELRAVCTAEKQRFQLNDRVDLAVLLDADGIHLPEAGVAAVDARRLLGPNAFVSRACHDPEGELEDGVDAWVLSPIFAERKGRAPLGVSALARLGARCRDRARVFALGGVSAENAPDALRAGAAGVVAVGAVLRTDEPEALLTALGIAV